MENKFKFVFDMVLVILIFIIFPITYFSQKTDTITQQIVSTEVSDFIDIVRSRGYISRNMYETFVSKLDKTNVRYDITLQHKLLALQPEYRLRTADEVIDEQNKAYLGKNIYTYRDVSTSVPTVDDPVNTGNLNSETNESVLSSAVSIPADPKHVHSSECYVGHHHNDKPSNFTWHHTHEYGKCVEYVSAQYAFVNCNNCGREFCNTVAYWHYDKGKVFDGAFTSNSSCPYCGSSSYGNLHMKYDYGYSCGYIGDFDNDGYKDQIPFNVDKSYSGYNIPQMSDNQTEYTDGCWTYRRNIPIPGYSENSSSYPTIYTWNWTVMNYILDGSWRKYSNFPRHMKMHYKADGITEAIVDIYFSVADGDVKATPNSRWGNPVASMKIDDFIGIIKSGAIGGLKLLRLTDYYYNLSDEYLSNNVSVYYEICNGQYSEAVIATGFKPEGWFPTCGKSQDETLDCDKIITSLSPTHPIQTVALNDPLITTVRATYKDGSSKVVVASTDFKSSNTCKDKQVNLTYTYMIDGVNFVKQCTITVTVIPRFKTCINGHIYNLNADGSDPGCPYCKAWLKSLALVYPVSESITIYKGTTLQENGVSLLAVYMNGKSEYVKSGYLDNLDSQYIGTQKVTISYKGKCVFLSVITKRNVKQCPVCNRYYELYPDGTDPGCPYCAARYPVFTGKVLKYYSATYTDEIRKEIYDKSGIYYFNQGDYFSISVTNKGKTFGTRVLDTIFHKVPDISIHVEDGGPIRNNGK